MQLQGATSWLYREDKNRQNRTAQRGPCSGYRLTQGGVLSLCRTCVAISAAKVSICFIKSQVKA